MNTTFLDACLGRPCTHVPVWFMRQAGRYLPEYQQVRRGLDFLRLCKDPDLATEVTLQPVRRLGVDAAILFSDILVPMEAMGLKLAFHEGKGPIFAEPVRDEAAATRLRLPDPEQDLPFVLATIRQLRRELTVPLIGFSGAPFTLATYIIEGGSSRNYLHSKRMMYRAPELYHRILDQISACTARYLIAQVQAGAQALQLFDSWAGALDPQDYARFARPYVVQVVKTVREAIPAEVPIIYFANNGACLLRQTCTVPAEVLGVDWRVDLDEALLTVRHSGVKAVQGNLDPLALFMTPEDLEAKIHGLLRSAQASRGQLGYIFNLGHGIIPETDPDQVRRAVDCVHAWGALA